MCVAVKGMVLKQFPLGYRGYKSESLGLEYGIIFRETDQLVEDLDSRLGKQEIATQKYKKSDRFCFG